LFSLAISDLEVPFIFFNAAEIYSLTWIFLRFSRDSCMHQDQSISIPHVYIQHFVDTFMSQHRAIVKKSRPVPLVKLIL